jgi:hypothetical protein
LEDYIELITDSLKRHLIFPEETVAHGFNLVLNKDGISELLFDEASEDLGTISAIDGGSNTIIKTPTSALILNRIYCNKFTRMKKLKEYEMCIFISNTEVVEDRGKICFQTTTIPIKGPCPISTIKIDSNDSELKIGKLRGDLDRALSMARRFSEWDFVEKAVNTGAEFILMDGALQTAFTEESEKANRLYEIARSAGVVVAGLSKSNTIYATEGFPIAGFLDGLAGQRKLTKWCIKLGRSEEWAHRANVYYAKLHEGADRAFRLDVFEGVNDGDFKRLLEALQSNSKYFAFPGLPYALIDAHIYAVVKEEEVKHIKDLILDRLTLEDTKTLELMERALMSHDVLDTIGG